MDDAPAGAKMAAYDVFLSHGRAQKPWVMRLAECLRARGLTVFFDGDSIEPGLDFTAVMSQAAHTAGRVLLVLARDTIRRPWVRMEATIAVRRDPAGERGVLIPLLLDPVAPEELPPEIAGRQVVALHDASTRDEALRRLLALLGGPGAAEAQLPEWDTLEVADLPYVERWGWNGVTLADALIRMDTEVYEGALVQPEEQSRRWAPVFWDHRETWRIVVDGVGQVVAYWHFVPLPEAVFDRVVAGQALYDEVTAAKLDVAAFPGEYDLYFAGVCVRAAYRRPAVFRRLFGSVLEVLEGLAREGVFARRIAANAYTDAGETLCRTLGLVEGPPHPKRGRIYHDTIARVLGRRVAASRPSLRRAYGLDGAAEASAPPGASSTST